MQKALPERRATSVRARRSAIGRGTADERVNLLLVTRDKAWASAVHGAAQEIDGGEVSTCQARDAVTRLAGVSSHYSHVLVDGNDADGLFDALADLAIEIAAPDTNLLALGRSATPRRRVRVIQTATSRSVREALMAPPPSRARQAIDPSELRSVLDGAMIETRYQPIIRIADRQPVGLEALARLNHPEKGTMLPDRFVPQLEDAGLAGELTRLVSAQAFADLAGPILGHRGLCMAVNFPLDVLLLPAALDKLEEQRAAFGLGAGQVAIELTESRPVEDFTQLGRSLEHLRRLGYRVAIDDVGPAVPRLEPLLELPFTCLKLDKELVQRIGLCADDHGFVARTIEQAKMRGLFVVAEGVETESIWSEVARMGADAAQGFLAARPLPVAAVPAWWEAWVGSDRADRQG